MRIDGIALASVLAVALAACGKAGGKPDPGGKAVVERPLLIAPEDILTLGSTARTLGPLVTGTLQPERRADLRAEVPAVVLQVLKDNGDAVRKGDLLVRLDDTAIRDSLASAEAAARTAAQALEQTKSQLERIATLRKSGMASAQALEDAENRRNAAQSEQAAAAARAVLARQQLTRTEARAPFDGIVSDRKVSAGDTAQVGKELVKVIDPSSLRFEGLVSADQVGAVRAGQAVVFRVNGYGNQDFPGRVARVNPAANATTRQVEVLVEFADAERRPRLAGLYAEGRIATQSVAALALPATAVVRDGDRAYAWRLKGQALEKAALAVGERDSRSGELVVTAGLAEGDRLLRHPGSALRDGQKVEFAAAAKPSVPAGAAKQ